MVCDEYTKGYILWLQQEGHSLHRIYSLLVEEGMAAHWSMEIIAQIHQNTLHIVTEGKWRKEDVDEVKEIVERAMQNHDETSTSQLCTPLCSHGHQLSLRKIYWCHSSLGWTYHGSTYWSAHLLRDPHQVTGVGASKLGANFSNAIFMDECSVQMESHQCSCCRKRGEPPRKKPQYVRSITSPHMQCTQLQ